MELFCEVAKKLHKPLIIFAKDSILDVWPGSEYASEVIKNMEKIFLLSQFERHFGLHDQQIL